ncbi:MAG: hypothetical protein ACRDD1_19845 [Planctomycetia bacterium]
MPTEPIAPSKSRRAFAADRRRLLASTALILGLSRLDAIADEPLLPTPDDAAKDPDDFADSAHRGLRWLASMQRTDGLFTYGWLPDFNKPLPDDNWLRQAGAAAALARGAAVHPELEAAALRAVAAIGEQGTAPDPAVAGMVRPNLPASEANPTGFAGRVLLAVAELPRPTPALAAAGEGLARFIAGRRRDDGSLDVSSSLEGDGVDRPDSVDFYPGEALYALMRSHARRPAAWKLEAVAKSFSFSRDHWAARKSAAYIPWQTAAFAEAYACTGESTYADYAFAMTDWLLPLQYTADDEVDPGWLGGFAVEQAGRKLYAPPGATTGSYAEALVEGLKLAERVGDRDRSARYRGAATAALRFLRSVQFDARTATHWQPWYAAKMDGAVPGSVVDGLLRIDFTQHAVFAWLHFPAQPGGPTEPSGRRNLAVDPAFDAKRTGRKRTR